MDMNKKRKATAMESVDSDWPTKAIPSLDSTLLAYPWPYGSAAMIEERMAVRKLLELADSIRMPKLDWICIPSCSNLTGIGILGMRVTVYEAFIESEAKRNALVDRAHEHFNTNWKLEVLAMKAKANHGKDEQTRHRMRFVLYEKTEEHLYATVDKIDKMRSMYEGLKPETINLVRRCKTTNEIRRCMVFPTEVCPFFNA